jgi:hypothetical protein
MIEGGTDSPTVFTRLSKDEAATLKYFLTRNFYYAVTIDDYPTAINNKDTLLEALYYEARLVTVHSLNWDALQEGFEDILDCLGEYAGICIVFKDGQLLKNELKAEFQALEEVLSYVNQASGEAGKKIRLILNASTETVNKLYERLRAEPFPVLGKRVGDFGLYDSLIAGYADRVSKGEHVPRSQVPDADNATLDQVRELRRKANLDPDERAFLEYFELLEELRTALLSEGT